MALITIFLLSPKFVVRKFVPVPRIEEVRLSNDAEEDERLRFVDRMTSLWDYLEPRDSQVDCPSDDVSVLELRIGDNREGDGTV